MSEEGEIDLEELKKIFDSFDKDKSGALDKDELMEMMTSLGMEVTPEQIDQMLDEADDDGNKVVDFEEFCSKILQNS